MTRLLSWLRKLARSFELAFAGIWHAIKTQQNMRIHLGVAASVTVLGIYAPVTVLDGQGIYYQVTNRLVVVPKRDDPAIGTLTVNDSVTIRRADEGYRLILQAAIEDLKWFVNPGRHTDHVARLCRVSRSL